MKLSNWRYIGLILIITLFVGLALTAVGCEELGLEPATEPEETPSGAVTTDDRAILAVYEHLLSQAEGYEAKTYLADFYTTCDNWSAGQELLKDGENVWYVTVDMSDIELWRERPYWQQASWLILQDGRVMPSSRFQASALRIEADLQELSLPPQ